MQLQQLTEGMAFKSQGTGDNPTVLDIQFDSRKVKAGSLFVALKGSQVDGQQFVGQAIQKGAVAIVSQEAPTEELQQQVPYYKVQDSAAALGQLASQFYGAPSEQLRLVGITGTNGKTTTATLLYELFTALGYTVGLISTVAHRVGTRLVESTHTTPDVLTLNALLAEMNQAGCEYAFMEVSSHAVDQKRIAGLHFEGGVFTNLSHDHLDYHKTFQQYLEAKKAFFDGLPKTAFALTNIDDRRGTIMIQNTKAKRVHYALRQMAAYKVKIVENNLTGLVLDLDGEEFFARLVGDFNAYNLLAVYATARLLGADKMEVLAVMSQLQAPEGRFEYVVHPQKKIMALVDYAHTPDALEKVLQTVDKLRNGNEQVLTVVGCGGDRDKAKRPLMAQVACNYSHQVILTSDNPRTEHPDAILEDMQKGIPVQAKRKTLVIGNRKQAIRTACRLAQTGDIIVVAGKGHEKYQEINGVKHPFDDKEELINALAEA